MSKHKSSKEKHKHMYYPIEEASIKAEIESLHQMNSQLIKKQKLYIEKLIKLEKGLEKQNNQFISLNQLYSQLLSKYQKKQQEVAQLQLLYRETQRKKHDSRSSNYYPDPKISDYKIIEMNHSAQIEKLSNQNKKLKTNYQILRANFDKVNNSLAYYRNKQKNNESRASLQSKVLEQIQQWQKQLQNSSQQKIILKYQNQFLKQRNQDLQKARDQLQKILTLKQRQISKLRGDKITIMRQNSSKKLNKSSSKSPIKSRQSFQLKNHNLFYQTLKKQNLQLKQKIHNYQNTQESSVESLKNSQFYSFCKQEKEDNIIQQNCYQIQSKENSLFPTLQPQLEIQALIQLKNK